MHLERFTGCVKFSWQLPLVPIAEITCLLCSPSRLPAGRSSGWPTSPCPSSFTATLTTTRGAASSSSKTSRGRDSGKVRSQRHLGKSPDPAPNYNLQDARLQDNAAGPAQDGDGGGRARRVPRPQQRIRAIGFGWFCSSSARKDRIEGSKAADIL